MHGEKECSYVLNSTAIVDRLIAARAEDAQHAAPAAARVLVPARRHAAARVLVPRQEDHLFI